MPARENKYVIFQIRGACFLGGGTAEQIARHLEKILKDNNYTVRGGTVEPTAVDWVEGAKGSLDVLEEFTPLDRVKKPKAKKPASKLPTPPPLLPTPPPLNVSSMPAPPPPS